MCPLIWPVLIKSLPAITEQDLTDLANKGLGGLYGHPINQRRWRVPCITTAIFLQSRKALLAHLSLSVAHMRRRDRSICLNLHIHILSTVWSYGVPDSPSYRHTSRQRELGAQFVIQAVLCIHSSIAVIQSSEGSHIHKGNHGHIHTQSYTHTNTHTLTLNCIKRTIKGRPSCSEVQCWTPTLNYWSICSNINTQI